MASQTDSPFHTFDRLAKEYPEPDAIIVDFHAEATSEKRAFAEYVSGRAQLVVGTHTHVPTADAQILQQTTAFITDLGMCGPQDSSLGAEKSEPIKGFLTGLPWRYSVGTGQCELGAAFCKIDFDKRAATHIEHIRRFAPGSSD
jgi:calcineurin-like phosphoesterase